MVSEQEYLSRALVGMKSPVLPEKRTFKREVCLVKISATTRGQVMMQKNWLQRNFTVTEPVPIEIRLYERALTGLCLVQMCLLVLRSLLVLFQ